MLAARGVSLGLGKINLSELNVLPSDRAFLGKLRRKKKAEEAKHKIIIKKHVDKQTLWVACRMVVVGGVTIAVGLLMTVVGYFDKDLTTTVFFNTTLGTTMSIVDNSLRYKLKSMQYIGPILMGFGMFMLIICCVITLESRDKHAQIIQEESSEYRRKSKLSMSATATKTSLLSPTGEQEKLQTPAYKENGQAMGKITTLIRRHGCSEVSQSTWSSSIARLKDRQ